MPRHPIDISAHRQTITWWILHEKWKLDRVIDTLKTEHHISLSSNTLKRNLDAWGVRVRPRINVTAELRQRIHDLFYQERYYTDHQMAKIMRRDGFTISHRKLGKLRKEMGLIKRRDTFVPANPVLPGETIHVGDDSSTSNDGDGPDMDFDPAITQPDDQSAPQPPAQPREPPWRKKRQDNASRPVHHAPPIQANFTASRHSPPAPHAPSFSPPDDHSQLPTTTIYSEPPANGQGLARRVATLASRIAVLEAENTNLTQQFEQQRTENADLRQQTQQQRTEMDMMRASLNELIARFNAAHY